MFSSFSNLKTKIVSYINKNKKSEKLKTYNILTIKYAYVIFTFDLRSNNYIASITIPKTNINVEN